MNNIFDFATKELSQDAFICWLFYNYNSKDSQLKEIAYKFINYLTDFSFTVGDIEKMDKPKQQVHDMDIVIDFWAKGLHYIVVIEDKTTSSAHDSQLMKYSRRINTWDNDKLRTIRVFYKTDYLTPKDEEELDEVDKLGKWKRININDIYQFFAGLDNVKSEILNSYIEHIKEIYNDSNNKELPKDNNIARWKAYFKNVVGPRVINDKHEVSFGIYRNLYAYLKVSLKGFNEDNVPYFEIRSRDCLNGEVIGRFEPMTKPEAIEKDIINALAE